MKIVTARSQIGVCLTAEDIYGAPQGLRECRETLSRLNLRETLFRLAFVRHANVSHFNDQPIASEDFQEFDRILSAIAGIDTRRRVHRILQAQHNMANFYAFSDQALMAAMELVILYCDKENGAIFDCQADLDLLARIVFSLQGATFSPQFKRYIHAQGSWDSIPERFLAELIRNHLAHNPLGAPRNGLARLYAIVTDKEIGAYFEKQTRESFLVWFKRRLGMSPDEYLRAAFLVGATAARYNDDRPDFCALGIKESVVLSQLPDELRAPVKYLLGLGRISIDEIRMEKSSDSSLTDSLYRSTKLRIRPFIDMGDCYIPATSVGVVEKFLIGLPHIFDEAARRTDSHANIPQIRMKFGFLFERYLGVLFQRWFVNHENIQVLLGYREAPELPEWDVIIVRGETAYYFEAKAKVFGLGMRTDGGFSTLDQMLLNPFRDTWAGAQKLLAAANRPDAPESINKIRRIVPALVVFDRIPIRPPYLSHYERHVQDLIGAEIFAGSATILPIQTFEIEGIESLEEFLEMREGSTELFDYLEARAVDPLSRHNRQLHRHTDEWRTSGGPMKKFVHDSEVLFEQMANQIRFIDE
jgi:hypothetical protein